eukprot:COSAG02_NODE_2181_length_9586_cov_3.262254_4_plen_58_part_00
MLLLQLTTHGGPSRILPECQNLRKLNARVGEFILNCLGFAKYKVLTARITERGQSTR